MCRLTKITATIIILFFNSIVFSQESIYFIKNNWQSCIKNPANADTNRALISIPSIGFNFHTPDFKIKQLLLTDSTGTLSLNDVSKNRIQQRNRISSLANVQTFGIGFKLNDRLTFNINHSINIKADLDFDGKTLKAAFSGLDDFVGNTYDFYSSINGYIYSSIGLGASYKLKKNIQIGGRIKYLNGISSFFTQNGDARVTFENYNYAMSFDNNINASAFSLDKVKELKTVGGIIHNSFIGRNKGISFDFGALFQFEKLQLSLSTVDAFGKIYWKYNGTHYSSVGQYEYGGVNANQLFVTEPSESKLSFTDSLKKSLGFTEAPNSHFNQKLSPQIYLSGIYDITDKWQVGGLVHIINEQYGQGETTIMFNAGYKITPKIHCGSTIGFSNLKPLQCGMYFNVKLGIFQIIGATDNIVSIFQPYNAHYSNGQLGINIAIK